MASTYDFIIVGGGTAGCLIAERLSQSTARPSVLLVEAGGPAEGDFLYAPFHRYMGPAMRSDLDYAYVTEPVPALNNREITYNRGKGLGGSTLLNFQVYLYGSGEDYNRWAELVDDDSWKWDQVHKKFKEIESYDFEGAKAYSHLANPDPAAHGKTGSVKVSLPSKVERDIVPLVEAMAKNGEKINLDVNSGNPVGVGFFPNSSSADGRTTSASAHLLNAPSNLTVWVNATVEKLVFEGTKVVGITTNDGRKATSTKEVILSSGAIDTPKLLLLNGIGPAKELEPLGIKVVKNLRGVGKHLQDHVMSLMCVEVDGKSNDRWAFESDEKRVAEALALWNKDKSGDMTLYHNLLWGGFLKLPDLEQYPEYQALDKSRQEHLSKESVPAFEFINNALFFLPSEVISPGNSYMTSIAFLMNPQSEGSVTLRSAKADDKPVIDLAFLSHPYDRRVYREAIRATWTKVFENPDIKKSVRKTLFGPASLSDEDIDTFVKESAGTVWHANGTAMMGRPENPQTVVDTRFKVVGIQGLRVADLSVCPLTTNNHTQATAYLIGQKAADTVIADHQLAFSTESKL